MCDDFQQLPDSVQLAAACLCGGGVGLGGQLAVELDKRLHELILEGHPLQLKGWSEKTVLHRERLRPEHDGFGLHKQTHTYM